MVYTAEWTHLKVSYLVNTEFSAKQAGTKSLKLPSLTVLYSSVFSSPSDVDWYVTLSFLGGPSSMSSIFFGTNPLRKFTPCPFMYSPTISAICWSNPRRRMDLTITVTSNPNLAKKPAHSSET